MTESYAADNQVGAEQIRVARIAVKTLMRVLAVEDHLLARRFPAGDDDVKRQPVKLAASEKIFPLEAMEKLGCDGVADGGCGRIDCKAGCGTCREGC